MAMRKMKLPFLSKTLSEQKPPPYPWQWPSCGHTKTLSFRAAAATEDVESAVDNRAAETPHSCFTNSSAESSGSFSTMSEESGSEQIETVIRGLRSERLFFEPGESNSILEEANKASNLVPFKESVVVSMESKDPFVDFRKSMEEMIDAFVLKDWDCLEELLGWYLRVNGKNNHGYIISAFADLLVSLSSTSFISSSSSTSSSSYSSASAAAVAETSAAAASSSSPSSPLSLPSSSSSFTTPCLSSLDQGGDDDDEDSHVSSQ
ncbi:hypothetical protein Nepgr_024998 [Nepenthes gracilis]|uniref:Transcription repressor n=1 Tax=Nepenthes gracilis TaxID=150966 RepID=A0AAD3T514_NEPGR|nr:hypothetical protein Nepgr_024998 [Nepenthes gracilis]